MNHFDKRNLTLLTDFYEITMANGYFDHGLKDAIGYFELFFRKVPDGGGYAIMAGLEQVVEYIQSLSFSKDEIEYLRNKNLFSEAFLDYLANFKFSCDICAIKEGTPIFPYEPVMTVKGPVIQAQWIETMLLLSINHQSLVATKTNRIVRAADGRAVLEFGARRAHGYDASIYGARAAYIGGVAGSSNTMSDLLLGIPAIGTMAHSWVQLFDNEYEAFKAYAETYPDNCVLLVDTFNVLKSGVPNAIKVFDEVLKPLGKRPKGIRLDSGDITYLSKIARKMLDEAGYSDCSIVASNSLDEAIIRDLLIQGAKVDSFGVGERLITSKSEPVFGGVYKLTAIEKDGILIPKIKISENVQKITNPGPKQLYRLVDLETNKAIADVITLGDEVIDDSKPYEIFDPQNTWKRKTIKNYKAVRLLEPIFVQGKLVYQLPDMPSIRKHCEEQIAILWEAVLRYEYPHQYYVDLSQKLWELKQDMLHEHSEKK
jgi:nicotinate phosphoribosyltransferase